MERGFKNEAKQKNNIQQTATINYPFQGNIWKKPTTPKNL